MVYRFWSIFGLTIDLTTTSMWVLPLAIGAIMQDKLRSNCNMQSDIDLYCYGSVAVVLIVSNVGLGSHCFCLANVHYFIWLAHTKMVLYRL